LRCCVIVRQSDSTYKTWLSHLRLNEARNEPVIPLSVHMLCVQELWVLFDFPKATQHAYSFKREFVKLTKRILWILKQKLWMDSYTWMCTTVYHPSCVGLFMFLWNTIDDGLSQKLGCPNSSWSYTTWHPQGWRNSRTCHQQKKSCLLSYGMRKV